ncbi:hypothetical protein D3C84_690490 [compost metagenome]
MRAAGGIDQLAGDAHFVTALAHTAFEHVAHAQRLADTLDVDRPALVGKAGVAGNDEQPADPRQGADDVFDDAIGKIILLRIAAEVLERQDRDRRLVGQHQRGWRCLLSFAGGVGARLGRQCLYAVADPHLANKAVTLAGHGAYQALLFAGIANGLAHGVDVAGDGRFGDDPASPYRREQLVLADHPFVLADQLQ